MQHTRNMPPLCRHAARAMPPKALMPPALPPCRHFPACGGCQLQHLDDQSWSGFIVERVASALAAQGLSAPIRAPQLSPPPTDLRKPPIR